MKILHLIYDHINNPWVGGGGAIRTLEIYNRISSRHDITIVSGLYPGAVDYTEGNVKVHFEGAKLDNYIISTFSYAFHARAFFKNEYRNYDLIVEDFAPWNPLCSYNLKDKIPVVLQIQNYLGKEILRKYNLLGVPFYFIEKKYARKFDNVIIINSSLAARFDLSRYFVVSNGIEEELLSAAASDKNYAAYLGRIDFHQKGLDVLLEAAREIPFKVKLAGDGRDRERLMEMMKGMSNVEWVGALRGKEKIRFLCESSFLVVPSRFEGQGIVVLEAAACGKPVILSNITELAYAVETGFGLSFEAGNHKDLVEKISCFFGNDSLKREMGIRAKGYAKNFTWEKVALDYEAYLMKIYREG